MPFPVIDLPPLLVGPRADRVRADLTTDALIVTALPNVRWLTGFTGSTAFVLVLADRLVLFTDGRYRDQGAADAERHGARVEIVVRRTVAEQREVAVAMLSDARTIGLEAHAITWSDQRAWAAALGPDLVATSGIIEAHRAVKDDAEIARIAACALITDAAVAEVVPFLADGPTEAEVALALDTAMRRLGASGPGFDTIVATGPNAALPHHRPDGTVVKPGHLVVLDLGAALDGYRSDMTRTVAVGELGPEQARFLAAATASQAAGVAAVRAGVATADVDRACRQALAEVGLAELFTHGTGHGLGLVIHEDPFLGATTTGILQEGNVVTVEPGVYRYPSGGARVEDTVVVERDGCRPLTLSPKDLRCLPSPRTTSRTA